MKGFATRLRSLSRHTDAFVALGVVGLVLLLIIPLPPLLLDTLLSLSIVLAVMTLLLTVYLERALDFSAFPSLLLFLTLFRLGLNIASTRMILSRGEGGDIIRTFGEFVTAGNTLVGLILFCLLTVINFIVVTKGAGRIAEVAARFNLEALPGKQAAVDAELSCGAITQEEARAQRAEISAEADFYGSMDGASKFVRGDAIAGLVITAVNILGGFLVGIMAKGMDWAECWQVFTSLTVGDGLVSQLPALLISVGAGIIVTRAAGGSVGKALPKQILANPKVLGIGALVLLVLSCVPGMPTTIMLALALPLFAIAYAKRGTKKESVSPPKNPSVEQALIVHPLEILLGYHLVKEGGEVRGGLALLRRQMAEELGIVIPSVHVTDHLSLPQKTFQIKIRGVTVKTEKGEGSQDILHALREVIRTHAHELIHRQDVAKMIEGARRVDAAVVEELVPAKMTLGQVLKVVQNLLKEQIPVRDFVMVLEAIADHLPHDGAIDPDQLTEHVRADLRAAISEHFFGSSRQAQVITLDPKVEQMVLAALQKSAYGVRSALRPQSIENIERELQKLASQAEGRPIVLTQGPCRLPLRRLLPNFPLPVLAYSELAPDVSVSTVGTIGDEVLL